MEGKIIGYDIRDTFCQISFYDESMDEPETYEASPESFQIPLIIGKRHDIWAIGVEAKRLSILHEGELASNLLSNSVARKQIKLENESVDAIWLLSKFVRMSLEKFSDISAIVFSVPELSEDIAQILRGIALHMGIEKRNIYVQDYGESFCNYMFYQPKELWQYEAALFYCDKTEVKACMLRPVETSEKYLKNTFVTVDNIASAKKEEMDVIYPLIHGEKAREADARFKLFIENVFDRKKISSVYLTGEGFENSWYPESLKVLCNGRRAFLGSNLYSKGACYTAVRRAYSINDGMIYIDDHKLTEQISLPIRVNGERQWLPIVTWGSLWYESDKSLEVLLEDTEDIELHRESIYKGKFQIEQVSLEHLQERDAFTIRLLIEVAFEDASICKVTFKDIGFGEFYPPTDFETEIVIDLGGNYGKHHSLS